MGEWPVIRLKDAVDPRRGISYGIVQPGSPVHSGVPIVRVSDIRNGQIATDSPLRVHRDIENQYVRTRLRGGELLITIVGTVGETVIVPSSLAGWNVARAVAVIPVDPEIGAYWVQLALKSPSVRGLIDSRLNTTVQATLNLGDLAQLPILVPPARDRESIAAILGALDDKIELNRRMNETLEAMARAIFKDWFVDFGPTRAKMAGQTPYLAPEIWSLFPDQLDNEGKPEGWSLGVLSDLLTLQRGFDLPITVRTSGEFSVMAASGHNGTHNEFMVHGPGVTTGRSGILGRVFFIHENFWPLNTSLWVKGFANSSPAHAYFLIQTLDFASFNAGSAVPTLNRNHVHSIPLQIPPKMLVTSFDSLAMSLFSRQRASEHENNTLAATRDFLLPKLMSGEIRVKDAERLVEA